MLEVERRGELLGEGGMKGHLQFIPKTELHWPAAHL